MQATDNQIQPNLRRAETMDHVSKIRTPAATTKQQLSRFSMTPNKIAYDLTEDRSAGPAVSTLAQLRRCWRYRGGARGKVASNLLPGPVNGAEGNPCQNVCEEPTITSVTDMEQTGREAVQTSEELVHKLNPALMLEKQASVFNSLTAMYLGRIKQPRSLPSLPSRKVAALPVGNVAAQPGAPTAPPPQPPMPQNLPPGMMAQQAGLPAGAGTQGAAAAMPPGPPPGAGASPPPGSPPPAAAPPLPAGQEQVAAAGAQPDPNMIQAAPPKPPSPLGRGQHLDTITSDSRSHPLNQLMDDAQNSEHQSQPDDHEEEGEDTSTIGGGGATRVKEADALPDASNPLTYMSNMRPVGAQPTATTMTRPTTTKVMPSPSMPKPLAAPRMNKSAAVEIPVYDHPVVKSLWSQRPSGATSAFIPLELSMQWRKEAAEKRKSNLARNLAIGAGVVGGGALGSYLPSPDSPTGKNISSFTNALDSFSGRGKQAEMSPAGGAAHARQIGGPRGLFGQPIAPPVRRYLPPTRPQPVGPSFAKGMGQGMRGGLMGMAGLAALSQIYRLARPKTSQPAPAPAQ